MTEKRVLSALMSVALLVAAVTGCGGNEGVNVKTVEPLSFEEVASNKAQNLTADEKESIVYRYMSDSISIDTEKLIAASEEEITDINQFVSDLNDYLTKGKGDSISDDLINYMLMEFARTPYEWTQTKTSIQGVDPSSRLMFVDVTYTTNGNKKQVLERSTITKGCTGEEILKQARYDDYMEYLEAQYSGDMSADKLYSDFVKKWGNPDDIIAAQTDDTLTERIAKQTNLTGGIGKYTYSGLIEPDYAQTTGMITFRLILNYRFNLGQKRGLEVKALYLKDYTAGNYETLSGMSPVTDETGLEVIKPYITRLLNSYRKAVEEINHIGLYQLFTDYAGLDKYYVDYGRYTYNKGEGFTYDIVGRSDTTLTLLVHRTQKVRARGSNMTFPTYMEELIAEVKLCDDDKLRLNYIIPIKSVMTGEPISVIKDVEGISEQMLFASSAFTEENKAKVENLIEQFSIYQLNQKIDADTFVQLIDIGISQDDLTMLQDTVSAISANEKITWVSGYITKSNSYVEVKLREIYIGDINNFDTEAVLSMINRDGVWKVVSYVRTLNVKTDKTDVNDMHCLCRVKKGDTVVTEGTQNGATVSGNQPLEIVPEETTVITEEVTVAVTEREPVVTDNGGTDTDTDTDIDTDTDTDTDTDIDTDTDTDTDTDMGTDTEGIDNLTDTDNEGIDSVL